MLIGSKITLVSTVNIISARKYWFPSRSSKKPIHTPKSQYSGLNKPIPFDTALAANKILFIFCPRFVF